MIFKKWQNFSCIDWLPTRNRKSPEMQWSQNKHLVNWNTDIFQSLNENLSLNRELECFDMVKLNKLNLSWTKIINQFYNWRGVKNVKKTPHFKQNLPAEHTKFLSSCRSPISLRAVLWTVSYSECLTWKMMTSEKNEEGYHLEYHFKK